MKALIDDLIDAITEIPDGGRFVLGITGCPGAGKSTAAESVVTAFNKRANAEVAVVVPMDGYHFSNETLLDKGLLPLKGIPDTFDADGFVSLLAQLKSRCGETLCAPKFDRSIEASIPDAIVIRPEHKLCVVEGNYLLLSKSPWSSVRQYLDLVWYVDVEHEVLKKRLQARHEGAGKTPAEAEIKVASTDLPNAEVVSATKKFADRIISNSEV